MNPGAARVETVQGNDSIRANGSGRKVAEFVPSDRSIVIVRDGEKTVINLPELLARWELRIVSVDSKNA